MSHVLYKTPHDISEEEPNEGLQIIWLSRRYFATPTCCHVCELQAEYSIIMTSALSTEQAAYTSKDK
jgi:hypothetical protein